MNDQGPVERAEHWYPVHLEGVTCTLVGRFPESELVVLADGAQDDGGELRGPRVVALKGDLAAAWFARMNGAEGNDARSLAEAAAAAADLPLPEAEVALLAFVELLVDRGLVERRERPGPVDAAMAAAPPVGELAFPPRVERPLDPLAWVEPLDLDALTSKDLVALGTFLGGTSNTGGTWSCSAGQAGIANAQTTGTCRPGTPAGYINLGWVGRPCGT